MNRQPPNEEYEYIYVTSKEKVSLLILLFPGWGEHVEEEKCNEDRIGEVGGW